MGDGTPDTSNHIGLDLDQCGTLSYTSSGPPAAYRTIVRLPTFERSAHGLVSEGQDRWIDNTLAGAPRSGAVMPGTGGVRKLRIPLTGRGKRGGARIIYYYRAKKERIYLILAYAKGVKANLKSAEKREIRRLMSELEAEP